MKHRVQDMSSPKTTLVHLSGVSKVEAISYGPLKALRLHVTPFVFLTSSIFFARCISPSPPYRRKSGPGSLGEAILSPRLLPSTTAVRSSVFIVRLVFRHFYPLLKLASNFAHLRHEALSAACILPGKYIWTPDPNLPCCLVVFWG